MNELATAEVLAGIRRRRLRASDGIANSTDGRHGYGRFTTATGLRIKDEPAEDDIKDYAETTMNELLGWYGYDKVDSRDTQGLNLTHFRGTQNSPDNCGSGSDDAGSSSREGSASVHEGSGPNTGPGSRPSTAGPKTSNGANSPGQEDGAGSADDVSGLPSGCIVCAWCQKVGMKLFTLKTSNGSKAFCSELCFTQCRRASFKKNKVCDWCKHVRHTVNYVDFQVEYQTANTSSRRHSDGDQQLQFCSDKCLNQYKMNIFCRETQAHLQMHPHLQEAANKLTSSAGASALNLITPELWLRECKGSNGHLNEGSDERDEPVSLPENLSMNAPCDTASSRKSSNTSPTEILSLTNQRTEKEPHQPLTLPKPRSHRDRPRRVRSGFKTKDRHHKDIGSSGHHRHSARSPSSTCSTPLSSSSTNSHNHTTNGSSALLNGIGLSKNDHGAAHGQGHPLSVSGLPPPMGSPFHGLLDSLRPPFIPPNMLPNPLNVLAQQQMETLFRLHQNLGLRPGMPPLHLPSGMFPPFPHFPSSTGHRTMSPPVPVAHVQSPIPVPPAPLPPPPPPPPQPVQPPSVPPPTQNNHSHQHHHKNSHHHSHPRPPKNQPATTTPTPTTSTTSSLLPPVTMMVPYPIMIPIPIPIPFPIPVPAELYKKIREENTKRNSTSNQNEERTHLNTSSPPTVIESNKECRSKPSPKCNNGASSSSKRADSVIAKLSKRDKLVRTPGEGKRSERSPRSAHLMSSYDRTSAALAELGDSTEEDGESSTPFPDGFSTDDDNTLSEDGDDSDLLLDESRLSSDGLSSRPFESFSLKLKSDDTSSRNACISKRHAEPLELKRLGEPLHSKRESLKKKCP